MEMISALVKNNKQFELFVYPDKNHSIYGGNTKFIYLQKLQILLYKICSKLKLVSCVINNKIIFLSWNHYL